MSEQQDAVVSGINDANVSDNQDVNVSDTTHDSSADKWVKKLLSQRNEAREQAEALARENEELKSIVEQSVGKQLDLRERNRQINDFKASVGQEVGENVESLLKTNPWLTVEQAYRALYPEQAIKSWPNLSMQWQVPNTVRADKTVKDMSDAELKEIARQEFAAMGVVGL